VEAVAAGDHVAVQLLTRAAVGERQPRPLSFQVGELHVADLEQERAAGAQPCFDQVLDDLRLAVDDDRLADQVLEVDPVPLPIELDPDTRVYLAFAAHPVADARLDQQFGRSLLEHAGPDPRFDVLAAAVLDHDRLDALQVKEMGERQTGRAGADDPDLRPGHSTPSSASTCCAIAKAEFAAGTPA
jgi:hypothetical protein